MATVVFVQFSGTDSLIARRAGGRRRRPPRADLDGSVDDRRPRRRLPRHRRRRGRRQDHPHRRRPARTGDDEERMLARSAGSSRATAASRPDRRATAARCSPVTVGPPLSPHLHGDGRHGEPRGAGSWPRPSPERSSRRPACSSGSDTVFDDRAPAVHGEGQGAARRRRYVGRRVAAARRATARSRSRSSAATEELAVIQTRDSAAPRRQRLPHRDRRRGRASASRGSSTELAGPRPPTSAS